MGAANLYAYFLPLRNTVTICMCIWNLNGFWIYKMKILLISLIIWALSASATSVYYKIKCDNYAKIQYSIQQLQLKQANEQREAQEANEQIDKKNKVYDKNIKERVLSNDCDESFNFTITEMQS